MSYFFRKRLLQKGDFPGHPFRGNQYVDANGAGAAAGEGGIDPDKYAESSRAHGMKPDESTEDFKRHAANMAALLERGAKGDARAAKDYEANLRQGLAIYGLPYAEAVDAAAKRIATERAQYEDDLDARAHKQLWDEDYFERDSFASQDTIERYNTKRLAEIKEELRAKDRKAK